MDREEWDEVAELCYQVLALDPDNGNAENKLRLFDPEDDCPHQRRHKLGFSYTCLSRWPGWLELDWDEPPAEAAETLETGQRRLIAYYLMGEEEAYQAAREAFDQALAAERMTKRPSCGGWGKCTLTTGTSRRRPKPSKGCWPLRGAIPSSSACWSRCARGGIITSGSVGCCELAVSEPASAWEVNERMTGGTMRQLLVECSDPGLVVSLAEES